jgi:putative sterol carrier protein
MGFFKDAGELKKVLGSFFEELVKMEEIKRPLLKAAMVIKFEYEDPSLSITIDSRGEDVKFYYDSSEPSPDVWMKMSADVAHKFWLGDINLPMAIARRQIVAKGEIPKILKLLPIVKPAYKLYPEHIKKIGLKAFGDN